MRIMSLMLAAGFAALSGCVSVLPEPEAPDALYKIDATKRFVGLSENLIVREPEAARLLAGQGMVSAGADGGLRMVSGVEWSGPATRQLQFAMIESFPSDQTGYAVAPELGIFADYELASRVTDLHLEGDRAVCEMTVSLIATATRDLLARTTVSASIPASDGSNRARALALSAAASDCAAQASEFAIKSVAAQSSD